MPILSSPSLSLFLPPPPLRWGPGGLQQDDPEEKGRGSSQGVEELEEGRNHLGQQRAGSWRKELADS